MVHVSVIVVPTGAPTTWLATSIWGLTEMHGNKPDAYCMKRGACRVIGTKCSQFTISLKILLVAGGTPFLAMHM